MAIVGVERASTVTTDRGVNVSDLAFGHVKLNIILFPLSDNANGSIVQSDLFWLDLFSMERPLCLTTDVSPIVSTRWQFKRRPAKATNTIEPYENERQAKNIRRSIIGIYAIKVLIVRQIRISSRIP